MKVNQKLYPRLFSRLKSAIQREINNNYIIIHKTKFKSNVGRALANKKWIKIPTITDLESIYIIFHEIAHVKFNHQDYSKKRNYMQELEAEEFSLKYLRKFNIHKDFSEEYHKIQERAINYVIQNIYYEIENGLKFKDITRKALLFCKIKHNTRPVSTPLRKTNKKKK